jgi:hypothetical protein
LDAIKINLTLKGNEQRRRWRQEKLAAAAPGLEGVLQDAAGDRTSAQEDLSSCSCMVSQQPGRDPNQNYLQLFPPILLLAGSWTVLLGILRQAQVKER